MLTKLENLDLGRSVLGMLNGNVVREWIECERFKSRMIPNTCGVEEVGGGHS